MIHGTLIYRIDCRRRRAGGTLALVAAENRRCHRATDFDDEMARAPWAAWGSFIMGAAIGLLPWLHTRLALPAGTLSLLLGVHVGGDRAFAGTRGRHALLLGAPIALSLAGWFTFFWTTYGTLNPTIVFGDRIPLDIGRMAGATLALAADQEFGLFPNAPVHLLWLPALWSLCRRHRRLGLELLLLVVPYVMALSAYPTWWAGSSAPARFPVPIFFPLGVAVAGAWTEQTGRGRAIGVTLLGASVMIAAALSFGGGGLPTTPKRARAGRLDRAARRSSGGVSELLSRRRRRRLRRSVDRPGPRYARAALGHRPGRGLGGLRSRRQVAAGDAAGQSVDGAGLPRAGVRAGDDGNMAGGGGVT